MMNRALADDLLAVGSTGLSRRPEFRQLFAAEVSLFLEDDVVDALLVSAR